MASSRRPAWEQETKLSWAVSAADLAAQQCSQLGFTERRQQVIDATDLEQRCRLFLIGVFNHRDDTYIACPTCQRLHLCI
jgi:hypothetical protein